jgi:hypothetical protein
LSLMLWELTPLTKHYDFGLGAMADAFEEAAECIEKVVEDKRFLNWILPVCFLRRHAIELFLKSMLFILERRFGGASGLEEVKVSVGGKLRSLTNIHSVGGLYNGLKEKLAHYERDWRPLCRTEWLDFPPELDAWILEIEASDKGGTFFRYPDPNEPQGDQAKSMFKETSVEEILASLGLATIPRITTLVADDDDNVKEVYTENRDVLARELGALRGATTLLSAANFGLRTELAGGR